MEKIWANRLIAGTKTWDEVTPSRKDAVKEILKSCIGKTIDDREFTEDRYKEIVGE